MTKLINALLVLGLIISGCNPETETKKPRDKKTVVGPETTAYNYVFNAKNLPKGFALDSLTVEDTIKRVKAKIKYIIENESVDYKFTEVIFSTVLALANKEFEGYSMPKNKSDESSIVYGVVDFSVTNSFISTRFVRDSYTFGAAHHNYAWISLNYNINEKRMFRFKDIFQLSNKEDSLKFISMVGRNLDNRPLELSVPFDSVDVFIKSGKDFLIGTNISWADGMQTAKLNEDSLWNFFKNMPE